MQGYQTPFGCAIARLFFLLCLVGAVAMSLPIAASKQESGGAQRLDEEYTAKIKEFTTEPFFMTKYVNHLPASDTVPTPLDVLGHIAGAADVLSYSHEVYRYMRAVADASPRVEVFTMGQTEEGREMILAVVSDAENIRNLSRYKEINAKLADPRTISEDEGQRLIKQAKPMYWATGAMHSGETGSPEMLMELVYRLAVAETPFIQAIRNNAIIMVTPILEVDGRDKRVDLLKLAQHDPEARVPRLLYWGKYVAHDNNRDALGLALQLTKNVMKNFLEYHPQVMHDLHESQPHLYTSTGSGPYNAWIDPILVDEWQTLAYQEVTEMTKMGVPGVWTHAFYDGWAPNYAFYAANGHNAIGRFYETQGAGNADTRVITTRSTNRTWYRPNPPLPQVTWSIRNNVNLQQSALLIAFNYVATHKEKFMENFYMKSQRSIAKATTEGPAAYVFPGEDPRPGQQAKLLNLLQAQGAEVHRAQADFLVGDDEYEVGTYVVRMDQPYSRMVDMLLDTGYYNVNDPRPYDDTGWTLGPLYNVETVRVEDTSILDVAMDEVEGLVRVPGGVEVLSEGTAQAFLINHNADNSLATFRFEKKDLKMDAAEASFEASEMSFNAGTMIVKMEGNPGDLREQLDEAGREFGFTAYAVSSIPEVKTPPVSVPLIALLHDWQSTQTEGWIRIALDNMKIPYDYISVHEVRDEPNLRQKYDAIILGPSRNAQGLVWGLPMTGKPVAWKKTDVTPNIGIQDETEDMRGGLEFEGLLHLRDFVQNGGVFITLASSSNFPIHYGLTQGVSVKQTNNLLVRGSVIQAQFGDKTSPIRYGYGDEMGVYFNQSPVLQVSAGGSGRRGRSGFGGGGRGGQTRATGRGTLGEPDIVQGRPRDMGKAGVEAFRERQKEEGQGLGGRGTAEQANQGPRPRIILRFHRDAKKLLISGMLAGGEELANTVAVVDVPVGDGHVVLFAINPMWRDETHGTFSLVMNSILHYDHLDAGTQKQTQPMMTSGRNDAPR